jgi:hypothetical protein
MINNCLNQDLQDYRMSRMGKIEAESSKDFNMDNLLQVRHSSGRERYTVEGARYKGEAKARPLAYSFIRPL